MTHAIHDEPSQDEEEQTQWNTRVNRAPEKYIEFEEISDNEIKEALNIKDTDLINHIDKQLKEIDPPVKSNFQKLKSIFQSGKIKILQDAKDYVKNIDQQSIAQIQEKIKTFEVAVKKLSGSSETKTLLQRVIQHCEMILQQKKLDEKTAVTPKSS